MKANWLILALAIACLIFALTGGPRRSYDSVPPAFDPTRAVRAVVMRPFYQAVVALDATADW